MDKYLSTNRARLYLAGGALLILLVLCICLIDLTDTNAVDVVTSASPERAPGEPREAMHYVRLSDNKVQCGLCFRGCIIPDGQVGFCRNRENRGGTLYSRVYALPSAVQVDPVEKEPLHHYRPGTKILCIGTAGCNFRCIFCQNWHLSQRSIDEMSIVFELPPQEVVQAALEQGIPSISFTYNEPTTCYEYLYDVARLAKRHGLNVIFHTNGSMKRGPLRDLLEYIDAVTVDLKGFTDEFYASASQAKLEPVLDTLKTIKESGVWLEIVNLIIPSLNDSPEDIKAMCIWIRDNLGVDVPLHLSRFFPSYRLTNLPPTPIETLEMAHRIAKEADLRYVSIGNVPGHPLNSTYCPNCRTRIIHRVHFTVIDTHLEWGKCASCGAEIAGIWD
ncbi:MAG: AmmeMemoRadiSam system radical SAM enzyme [Bacillota bacterium]|nr:AmmeMemoRadiSam system radical SAM enzyme [Bacillota bacterium]